MQARCVRALRRSSRRRARRSCSAPGNADAELMFVGEAPGASEDEQGVPFVGRAGKLLETLLGEIGLRARGCVHREHAQVPASRQPRPAAGRDRELPGVPAAPGRADRADGDLHARQLLDEAAARRPDRDHPPARPARGARARGARGAAVPDLPPGGRAVHAADARDAARGLRAAARAARARRARAAAARRGGDRRSSPSVRRRGTARRAPRTRRGRRADSSQAPRTRRGRPPRSPPRSSSWACSRHMSTREFPAKQGYPPKRTKITSQALKSVAQVADTGPVSIPPGVTTGPRPILPRVGPFNGRAGIGGRRRRPAGSL